MKNDKEKSIGVSNSSFSFFFFMNLDTCYSMICFLLLMMWPNNINPSFLMSVISISMS